MKLSITGSRSISVSFDEIKAYLPKETTCIVSGGASGVDNIASQFAKAHDLKLVVISPDYNSFTDKRLAPLARNTEIISESDYCLFFWDGVSKGTKDTINKAVKLGKHGKVVVIGTCAGKSVLSF